MFLPSFFVRSTGLANIDGLGEAWAFIFMNPFAFLNGQFGRVFPAKQHPIFELRRRLECGVDASV